MYTIYWRVHLYFKKHDFLFNLLQIIGNKSFERGKSNGNHLSIYMLKVIEVVILQKFIWTEFMFYFFYENGKLLASSPYRGSHSANQQMHFLIDLKGISVNGVELLIISVTLIVNQKVNQMGIPCLCHLNCLEFFKIVMRLEISWLVYHIKCWLATNVFFYW